MQEAKIRLEFLAPNRGSVVLQPLDLLRICIRFDFPIIVRRYGVFVLGVNWLTGDVMAFSGFGRNLYPYPWQRA